MLNSAVKRETRKIARYGIYPKKIVEWFNWKDDFEGWNEDNDSGWIETAVSIGTGTSALAKADGHGGILHGVSAANENDGAQIQWASEFVRLTSYKRMFFECRLKISEKTQSDLLVGLCIRDTSVIAGLSDGIFFMKDDGDANIDCVTVKDTSHTDDEDSGVDIADATYVRLGIFWDGVKLNYYIDGKMVQSLSTAANIPTDEDLTPTIAFLNGSADVRTWDIDYIRVEMER